MVRDGDRGDPRVPEPERADAPSPVLASSFPWGQSHWTSPSTPLSKFP